MNDQDKTLYDFADQVMQRCRRIMALGVGAEGRTLEAGAMACDILTLAAQMQTYAETRESMSDPNRYDLATLPARAAFDE